MNIFRITTGCAVLLWIGGAAQADIVTPVNVTATSEFAAAINMINGNGLSGVGPVESQRHNNDENAMWQTFSATPVGESATFELDANYDLSSALIWQYNGPDGVGFLRPDREVDEFEVLVSPDLVSPFTSVGTFNLAPALDQSVADFNEPAQTFALPGATDVRRVQLVINSLQNVLPDPSIMNPGDLGGFSEVRFDGTIIPEPAALALLVLGMLGLMGVTRRR